MTALCTSVELGGSEMCHPRECAGPITWRGGEPPEAGWTGQEWGRPFPEPPSPSSSLWAVPDLPGRPRLPLGVNIVSQLPRGSQALPRQSQAQPFGWGALACGAVEGWSPRGGQGGTVQWEEPARALGTSLWPDPVLGRLAGSGLGVSGAHTLKV